MPSFTNNPLATPTAEDWQNARNLTEHAVKLASSGKCNVSVTAFGVRADVEVHDNSATLAMMEMASKYLDKMAPFIPPGFKLVHSSDMPPQTGAAPLDPKPQPSETSDKPGGDPLKWPEPAADK